MVAETKGWRARDWWTAFAVAIIAAVVYLPSLSTWFASDDVFVVTIARQLGLQHPIEYFQLGFFDKYYRPLTLFSQAIDWQLWHLNAAGFHLTNLLLHAANTALVYAVGRRLLDGAGAMVAALLFALHPASHEAVYWISGRFDLLATLFSLVALLLLTKSRPAIYVAGLMCLFLALLSKESAAAVPVMVTAYDVIVSRRSWPSTILRLAPMLATLAGYAVLRSAMAHLAMAGGDTRLPKIVMLFGALTILVWIAWQRDRRSPAAQQRPSRLPLAALAALVVTAALGGCLILSTHVGSVTLALRFVTFATFHLLSPVAFPPVPPFWIDDSAAAWRIGFAIAVIAAAGAVLLSGWAARHRSVQWFAALVVAALIPVSSLTEGPRYVYLATAATSLLIASAWRAVSLDWMRRMAFAIVLVLTLSLTQMLAAAAAWHYASSISRDGLTRIAADLQPCGTKAVILLTTPVNIGGARVNYHFNAPAAFDLCPWASLTTVLRVWNRDVHVEPASGAAGSLVLRVDHYAGNIEASNNLHDFNVRLNRTRTAHLDTPIGIIDASPDGDAEVFVMHLTPAALSASIYYYSDGAMHALRPGG